MLKCVLFVGIFCMVHISTAFADIAEEYKDPCTPPCCQEIRAADGMAATGKQYFCKVKDIFCHAWCQKICPDGNDGTTNGTKCASQPWQDERCVFGPAVPPEDGSICSNPESGACLDIIRENGISVCNYPECHSMMSGQHGYCYLQEQVH